MRIEIDGLPDDAPELELSRLLDEYRTAREQRYASESNRVRFAAGLLVVGLQQRCCRRSRRSLAVSECIARPFSAIGTRPTETSA